MDFWVTSSGRSEASSARHQTYDLGPQGIGVHELDHGPDIASARSSVAAVGPPAARARAQTEHLGFRVVSACGGELLELGAQSRALRDEARNGVVHRQEGTGEASDGSSENRL
jgi:hypothetical protein